jgi:nitrite reductase (NADH) small subunit
MTANASTATDAATFVAVCPATRLTANRGVAALVEGQAVAIFALADGQFAAIDNIDPCSGASVLSRGIVGDVDGAPAVASPMYKQRFDLRTGRCLDVEDVIVAVHHVRVIDGILEVALGAS